MSEYQYRITTSINFLSIETDVIGNTIDLRGEYPPEMAGVECLICREVVLDSNGKSHILNKEDPNRIPFLEKHIDYIAKALYSPEIVYSALVYKSNLGRWSQVYAKEVPGTGRYMTVVLALASLEEGITAVHHTLTIIDAGIRYFYGGSKGQGSLKPKWKKIT